MRELAERLLAARRRGSVRSRPVFETYAVASPSDFAAAEAHVRRTLPSDLKSWLLLVGFGDVGEELGFRKEFFSPLQAGEFKGGTQFAQDVLGNLYAFPPNDERVVFFSRSEPSYAVVSPTFMVFMEELQRRHYKLIDWVDSLELSPYAWAAA
jgi:hypothetical protein